ncbi:MAG: hypothetical protein ACPLRW_12130 [Moorellales bacterium]
MELKVDGRVRSLPSRVAQTGAGGPEEFWVELENEVLRNGRVIETVIINGIPVYDSHLEVIISNWPAIEKLEIVTVSQAEARRRLAETLASYLEGLVPHLEDVSSEFYLGAGQQAWKRFEQLLVGLQWVVEGLQALGRSLPQALEGALAQSSQALRAAAKKLAEAVQERDEFLVGDLLRGEMAEQLALLRKVLSEVV